MNPDLMQARERYKRLAGERPADPEYVRALAKDLELRLPTDFLEATAFFDATGLTVWELHALRPPPGANVMDETRRIREAVGLAKQFLVLGEPPESLLVMDCSKGGEVLWCGAFDVGRLGKEKLLGKVETWPSFTAFLAELLDEEERERNVPRR